MEKFRVRTVGLVCFRNSWSRDCLLCLCCILLAGERNSKTDKGQIPLQRDNQVRLAIGLWTCEVEMALGTAFLLPSLPLLFLSLGLSCSNAATRPLQLLGIKMK